MRAFFVLCISCLVAAPAAEAGVWQRLRARWRTNQSITAYQLVERVVHAWSPPRSVDELRALQRRLREGGDLPANDQIVAPLWQDGENAMGGLSIEVAHEIHGRLSAQSLPRDQEIRLLFLTLLHPTASWFNEQPDTPSMVRVARRFVLSQYPDIRRFAVNELRRIEQIQRGWADDRQVVDIEAMTFYTQIRRGDTDPLVRRLADAILQDNRDPILGCDLMLVGR